MRRGEVMRPFRAPRKCVAKPARAEQTDQIESGEATEFVLVRSSWIVKETEEDNLQTSQDRSYTAVPEKHLVPELESHNFGAASPNVSEFENYLMDCLQKALLQWLLHLKPAT
jgi:hypothetical protein